MWFLTLAISLSLIFMGLVTFIRNKHSQINVQFFLLNIAASTWVLANYFEAYVSPNFTRLLVSLDFSLALAMVFAMATFSIALVDGQGVKNILKENIIGLISAILVFLICANSNLLIRNVERIGGGINVVPGVLYVLYAIILIGILTGAAIVIGLNFRKANVIKKQQIKYMSFGLIIAAIMLLLTNLIIPRVINSELTISVIPQFGYMGIVIFVGFSTYAIVRHRLMDIRMVVARSVTYSILLFILGLFYGGAIFLAQTFLFPKITFTFGYVALQIGLALIMAFTFQPLRRWITRVTDKIFFKNQYDPEQLLDTLSHTIGSSIVLIELVYKTLDLLMGQMKITRGTFVIVNENGSIYNSQSSGYKESPSVNEKDIDHLVKDGILLYDELEEGSKNKHLMQKYDVSVVIPLKTENTIEGLLMLGEKSSGDMFSEGDLKVFEIIAPEIAVAVTNAKSFEKIEKFNVTLRQEIKKATSELEKKNEQLRELDKAKDEFISMASHQLRTPLTAIKGYLSMLLEGDAGEIKVSQYDFVNEAFSGANRMVGLINDLLNVSRMETGRFFLEPVEVDMEKLVSEEVKQLENHAKEKKLYLKYEIKGKTPHIWVDETKMRQVVMNFIDNALYYTTDGGVTVTLEHDKSDVIFKVEDTGIGVPKEQQKNLFTKFYRADNARHVRPDGTGLGIYLAKRVMDDHGGTILFHSAEGKGSMFGFKMPIKSKLKMKRASAPTPFTTPAAGELAAGIGVPAETLEATSSSKEEKQKATIDGATGLDLAKAAGVEAPLPDSPDASDLAKESAKQKESVLAAAEAKSAK